MNISYIIPYRNRNLRVFEQLVADSISMQPRQFDEVIIGDFQSEQPYASQIEELCSRHDFTYKRIDLGASDAAIDIFLWSTLMNKLIREAKGDVIITSGIDKMLENDCAEQIEACALQHGESCMFRTKAWQYKNDPWKDYIFTDYVTNSHRIRGYGFWGATKQTFQRCHGLNEKIRWFEDLELFGRGRIHKVPIPWINNGKTEGCRVVHIMNHEHLKTKYMRDDIRPIYQLGKTYIRMRDRPLEANNELWGIITQDKLDLAERLAKTLRRRPQK